MDRTRTALVTGATSGLGRHTAGLLAAAPGWRVLVGARDVDAGRRLAGELGPSADVVPLDLADLGSVRAAAATAAGHAPVDALLLVAGLQSTRADRTSPDGFELTSAVNHLGHFLLTQELLPHLAPGARVVVVSSGTHFGTFRQSGPFPGPRWADPRELARPRAESGARAYATSKLANVYFGRELARRHPELSVAVYDPGLMPVTGLARAYPAPVRGLYAALAPLLTRLPFAQEPAEAAARLAALVTGPAGRSGRYVERDREAPSSPESTDPDRARELWDVSAELVGVPAR